jgi:hypothetical protein
MAKGEDRDPSETGDESRYGEELLRANWNPVIDLLQWSCDLTPKLTRSASDVSDEEAAAFLRRIYNSGA